MTEPKSEPAWCQHPVILGLACGAAFFLTVTALIAAIPPAWAISIPIGNVVYDLGDLAPWISIGLAILIWRDTRAAKKSSAVAVVTAAAAVESSRANSESLKAANTKIDGMLEDRDRANVVKGEDKGKKAAAEIAAALAHGQQQGIELERASVAAANPVPPTAEPHAAVAGKKPLPVVDERTAKAVEGAAAAAAAATDRAAATTEKKK